MNTGRVRILIVDDHVLVRQGVARLLSGEPDFEIVGQCSTVEEGLDKLSSSEVDLVLLDIDLGESRGGALMLQAHLAGFTGRFLAVTAGISADESAELLRLGVAGIFLKQSPAEELPTGIRSVMAGKKWIDSRHETLMPATKTHDSGAPRKLTAREKLVLKGVLEGMANKQIAGELGVSESSVKGTLQQLFEKSGVRTRSQLVRVALEKYLDQI